MTKDEFIIRIAQEQKSLRRFLLALCCGDQDLADDIAQETFIKAYLSLAQYHEQSKFSAWIKAIAHNTFLDSIKTKKYICLLITRQLRQATKTLILHSNTKSYI